ncbi:MAG: hypothetical protein IJT49_02895 [Clostridia bacterium]|nr:hypothetical protein [Clostridia bacterium]
MTKTKLQNLFDYQHFENDLRLQKVIDGVHRRVEERELTDDELDSVSAAGVQQISEIAGKKKMPGGSPV